MSDSFERSSGNVFADLGHPEADTALAKAKLILQIKALLTQRGWTTEQTAAALEIDHERLAALGRGRVSLFSTDDLIRMLTRLNLDVEISIVPNPSPNRSARVVVHSSDASIAAVGPSGAPSEARRFD